MVYLFLDLSLVSQEKLPNPLLRLPLIYFSWSASQEKLGIYFSYIGPINGLIAVRLKNLT
jgi:hypothetical protein